MFDFSHLLFQHLIAHKVGNKAREEACFHSEKEHPLEDDDLQVVLFDFFFSSFKSEEQYHFSHSADLRLNEMYSYCKKLFADQSDFVAVSRHMLEHLYERSDHPNIKSGELYIAYFKECLIDDELVDAIGIFKSERKSTFLRLNEQQNGLHIYYQDGIDTRKLDKGCLIFNTLEDDGYLVKIIDSLNQASEEAKFWKEDFLGLKPVEDSVYSTRAYLNMYKDFVEQGIEEEEEPVEKTQRFQEVSKAVQYFEEHEDFNFNDFAESVIAQPEKKEQYMEYKRNYEASNRVELADEFEIAEKAVKREKRKFKQEITLDGSIKIRLNPDHQERNAEMLERGFDASRGMYYYKLWYTEES